MAVHLASMAFVHCLPSYRCERRLLKGFILVFVPSWTVLNVKSFCVLIVVQMSDAFGGRLKVGLQAFANAVSSAPEIWIPLMTRLAAKSEARSLGSDVAASLLEVYRNRTSEASFLFMSKALHEKDRRKQASS